jgi:pilus assembly protein Flp/PilA
MMNFLKKLWKDEEGQDLIEYGLLLTLIALVCIASLNTISNAVKDMFSNAVVSLS